MTVRVRVPILAVECKFDCAGLTDSGIDRLQIPANVFKRHRLQEGEVKVLRKPVVAEVAALEGSPALEGKAGPQVAPSQFGKEPGQAIIAFENALWNPAATGLGEAVGKKREIALRYQIRSSALRRVLRATRLAADATLKCEGPRLAASDRAPRTSR